jgi:hypothetical protein
MEIKIDDIFTYNGKTYKVLKATDGCKGCTLRNQLGTCISINKIENCFASYRKDKTSIIFKEINNMEIKNNQLTIDIPKGMEIDTKNSNLAKGIIKFRFKYITYDDIENTLHLKETCIGITGVNNIEKLSAINELMNIAKYYNKDWKPDWDAEEFKYFIVLNHCSNTYKIDYSQSYSGDTIYFKNREDAQSVIDNPNFREILDTIFKN